MSMFHDSKEGQTHYFGDGCIPAHEPISEKPGETWEERYDVLVKKYVTEENMKAFIASEIQSAVEAERRRISEEAAYIESHKAFHCRFDELVKVINQKK